VPKQPRTQRRSTDWENLNYVGAKFIQGVVIRANTFGAEKQIEVQFEGGHVGAQLTLLHDGETQYAYPLEREAAHSANFPFTAELVRLAAVDDLPWALYDWRWVWEPEPEASTHWQTQRTTYDAPGFVAVADVVLAYRAFCPVTLRVYHDHTFVDYTFPASTVSGQNVLYSREYQRLEAAKGKSTRFEVFADSPFRLYKRDCSVRVQRWGAGEGYLQATPFGGPHREDGAAI
jgi:hypothetical protein